MLILSILKRYWKPLSIVGVSIILLGFAYYKGYNQCRQTSLKKELKDYDKRITDYIEVRDKNDRISKDIDNDRIINPVNDKRDSCLLSNNPLETQCLE